MSTAFGPSGIVLMDLMQNKSGARVFFIDTAITLKKPYR